MKVHYLGPNVWVTNGGNTSYGCLEVMEAAAKGNGFAATSILRSVTCTECRKGIVIAHKNWREMNGKA